MRNLAIRIVARILASAVCWSAGVSFAADNIHWTVTGPTSVTVHWRGTESNVSYGLTRSYGQSVAGVSQAGMTCDPAAAPNNSGTGPYKEARITGLQGNTAYHYKVGSGGADHTFRTPPSSGSSGFTVMVEGDLGDADYYHNVTSIQNMIASDLPSLVLVVGDLTYKDDHGGTNDIEHFNDVMVWSQDAPYMPVWGNHEWQEPSSDDLRNYKGRFDLPNPQRSTNTPTVSDCGEDWYWFDYGNTRFIAYPEPTAASGGTSSYAAWTEWYNVMTASGSPMATAQNNANIRFIVTFGHRPAFSSGYHSGDATLKGYLNNLACQYGKYVLNLNAHSHNYERSLPQKKSNCGNGAAPGVVHVTVGTGGSGLEQDGTCLWSTCTQPAWSAARYMRQGVLKLRFMAAGIRGNFLCGPAGGGVNDVDCDLEDVIDTFTVGCNDADDDGYGATGDPTCPSGQASDCDDDDASIYPGAPQACDGVNNNCNAAGWPSLAGTNEVDHDGDDLSACDGDCNDNNPSIYPGASQVCDGVNNNCLAAGWPSLAGTSESDNDGDGLSGCTGDCDDSHASVRPGAPEIIDGIDNQCPGNPGHGLTDETTGNGGFLSATNPKTEYSWPSQQSATGWEVARARAPDFSAGCGTVATSVPKWTDTQVPSSGGVFYYLVHSVSPFVGSWGAHSSGVEWHPLCPGTAPTSLTLSVAASSDDAEEASSGSMLLTNEDLDLVYDGSNQTVGIRFRGVTIPHGATIQNAYLQFEVRDVTSSATSLTIRAENGDNPPTFTSGNGNISNRSRTSAFASWSPPAWNTDDEAGPNQKSPNLGAIVQEVVSRTGWVSGNSLVIMITGTGSRSAKAWDYESGVGGPRLQISFTGGGP